MMLSADADSIASHFKRMRDIKITSIPIDPLQLVLNNRWQIATYQAFSLLMHMEYEAMIQEISPRAFSFYSNSRDTYFIIYNSDLPLEEIPFHLAHEIGHIFYGHVSAHMPVMTKRTSRSWSAIFWRMTLPNSCSK